MFQTALAPIGAVLVQSRGTYRIAPADQLPTGVIATGRRSGRQRHRRQRHSRRFPEICFRHRSRARAGADGAEGRHRAGRRRAQYSRAQGLARRNRKHAQRDLDVRCRRHEGHVVCRRSGEDAAARRNGRRTEGGFRRRERGAAQGPCQVHRQHAARRHSGRDVAAELSAPGADLDQAARRQGRRLRAAASRLSGAEPAGRGARGRAAVDVCE